MQSKILSIDSGSSFMKAYCGSEEKIQFPAIVRDMKGNKLSGKEMKIGSRYYLVGHSAATSMNIAIKTPHIEEDFHGSTVQYVQMCYAMERLKKKGAMDRLICSLPYSDSLNRDLQKKLLDRKTFEWSVADADGVEFERKVEFDHVSIVPQGVGAMQLHIQQSRERNVDTKCRAVMLIDVGSCTTDVVTIQENDETNEYEFCDQACTTIEYANVNWFAEQWIENLKYATRNIGDRDYDYYSLMRHAIEGDYRMQIGDRIIDAKPAFEQARNDFTYHLKPQVQKAAGDKWHEVNKIIFTGGGSNLIDFDKFRDRRILSLNQWANAEGQFGMFHKEQEPAKKPTENAESDHRVQASA